MNLGTGIRLYNDFKNDEMANKIDFNKDNYFTKTQKSEINHNSEWNDDLKNYINKKNDLNWKSEREEILRKSKDRFESKLDSYYRDLQNGKEILWLVTNESMKKFVDEQIKSYKWKIEQHHIQIFNDN